jgi:ATP adenylyltransferase
MDRIWAPWRIKYIQSKKKKKCIFCNAVESETKNYVFIKNKLSFAMLNIYPYNNGHALVAPLRHTNKISKLKDEDFLDMFDTLNTTMECLDKVLKPQGYNIGINLSGLAGSGISGHLHIHIVPRWKGDTNFMPVIYDTKVVSQSLQELYRGLKNVNAKRNKRIRR